MEKIKPIYLTILALFIIVLIEGIMADKVLFEEVAFKHGYTQEDIERAIETQIYDGPLEGEDDIYAIIGFDTVGNPIEVFYNIIDDDTIKVFHAMYLRDKVAAQMHNKRAR